MRLLRSRRSLVFAFAAAATAIVPAGMSMLQAQVLVCYVEWCIPKGAGESCIVKVVPCVDEVI